MNIALDSFGRCGLSWSLADIMSKSRSGQVRTLGMVDEEYVAVAAQIVGPPERIFERAKLIVKVKEPRAVKRRQLHRGQTVFAYLHLASDRAQVEDLLGAEQQRMY